jgi:hypothetical protein
MKKLLLSLLACGMFASAFAQIELQVNASVIVVDNMENMVYARKTIAGNMFSFSVEEKDIKKFQSGKIISVRFEAKKVTLPPEDERITISDLEVPFIKAQEFSMKVDGLEKLSKPAQIKNKVQPTFMKMYTVMNRTDESSTLVRVCCEEKTANGFEFTIPTGMTVLDLEREVYIYSGLAFTDQRKGVPSLLVFSASGRWIDTTRIPDSTHPSVSKGWEQKDNIKVRPNTSETDKWIITPVKDMKGVLGRLDINFPADAERSILIYQPTDNKFIASVSRNAKIYTIAPGQYRFTLTNVPVDNVPIQKGHETRLRAGILSVVSDGNWILYGDTKEKQYTSGNMPKKIPLPVGNYQLNLGTQFYPFVIKDGGTVEF